MGQISQTPVLVFLNILLILILLATTYNAFRGKNLSTARTAFIIIVCLLFCMFSFWGKDWYGYMEYFALVRSGFSSRVPMEEFYLWLMADVCSHYIDFRIIVWGLSLLFLLLTFRTLKLNIGLALFFFCNIYLIYFSYARVTLAITMMFYGYSCICRANHRLYKTLWGIFGVILSFYFHKSAPLGISSLLVSLFVLKLGRKAPIILLVSFPIMYMLINTILNDYFQILLNEDSILSEYATTGALYFDMQNTRIGISAIINRILERTPYYLLAYISFKELYKPSIAHPRYIRAFFMAELVLIVFSSIFIFDFGMNTNILYGRLIRFAQVPSVILMSYLYDSSIISRTLKLAVVIGIINCFYTLSYSLYNTMTV